MNTTQAVSTDQWSAQDASVKYAVDVVFCIDVTGSMGPAIDHVKGSALRFYDELTAVMARMRKGITQLRVRCVSFRDFGHDGPHAIETTDFFSLPDQATAFRASVEDLRAGGGGDEPESGLEALALAIRSDWERGLDRRRHICAFFTDASAHPLGKHHAANEYGPIPQSMPDLSRMWGDEVNEGEMEYSAKRLLLYAPEVSPWTEIANSWENVIHYPSEAGVGIRDYEMTEVLDAIAGSV